jgi:hypothetical protein
VTSFASDSERYVAWQVQKDSPVVVLDTQSGERREIAGCGLTDPDEQINVRGKPAGHGLFIVYCAEGAELLDAQTGVLRALPGGKYLGPLWARVGARYLEGEANHEGETSTGHCLQDAAEQRERKPCIAFYDIATGAVSYRPQSQPGNLNRPGAPLVCPALRKKVIGDTILNPGDYDGELFGEPDNPLRISRCHGRPIIIPDAHLGEPHLSLDIHGGLASWDSGHNARQCAAEECSAAVVEQGSVSAYSFVTGRRWTLKPPADRPDLGYDSHLRGIFGYSAHTRNMLFWIATTSVESTVLNSYIRTSAVYAAKL